MIIGIDARLDLDEAHALVWALEHLSLLAESRVISVPSDVIHALSPALHKTMNSVIAGIQWVGGSHPLEPIDANGNYDPKPQPQTTEVPFRE